MLDERQWMNVSISRKKSDKNVELITTRAFYKGKKLYIRISIGTVIGDLISIKKGNRINVYSNKNDRNLLLLRKSIYELDGYKLSQASTGSFLTFDFIYHYYNDLKLTQTTIVDFEINDDKTISININKLRWKK